MKKRVGIYTIGTMGFLMACGVFGEEPREQVLAGAKPDAVRRDTMTDDPTVRTFWISFANEHEFGGVNIIDLSEDEIGDEKWILAAVDKTIALGINPGPDYAVQGQRLPTYHTIPARFKNRLLNKADADEAQSAATSMH